MLLLLMSLALAPVIAIILFVYFKDKYEKEPFKILLNCFGLGIVSVIPAVLLQLVLHLIGYTKSSGLFQTAIYAFIIVGFTEEFSKFFFLRYYAFQKKDFNEPYDGIIYSVMISMGFAALENILYVLDHGLETALLRAFTAVPAHAAFGVIMGFYAGKAKFCNSKLTRFSLLATGLVSAVLLHGMYDFFLMQNQFTYLSLMAFAVLIIAIILSFRAIRIRQRHSPFKP